MRKLQAKEACRAVKLERSHVVPQSQLVRLYYLQIWNIQKLRMVKLRCELILIANTIRKVFKVSNIRTPLIYSYIIHIIQYGHAML